MYITDTIKKTFTVIDWNDNEVVEIIFQLTEQLKGHRAEKLKEHTKEELLDKIFTYQAIALYLAIEIKQYKK